MSAPTTPKPAAGRPAAAPRSPRRLIAQSTLRPSAPPARLVRAQPYPHGRPQPSYPHAHSHGPAAPSAAVAADLSHSLVCPFMNSRPCMRPPFASAAELLRHCRAEHTEDAFGTDFYARWNTLPRVREALAAWVNARKPSPPLA